jgi:hypothetical protein
MTGIFTSDVDKDVNFQQMREKIQTFLRFWSLSWSRNSSKIGPIMLISQCPRTDFPQNMEDHEKCLGKLSFIVSTSEEYLLFA